MDIIFFRLALAIYLLKRLRILGLPVYQKGAGSQSLHMDSILGLCVPYLVFRNEMHQDRPESCDQLP